MTARTRIITLVTAAFLSPWALAACSSSGDDAPKDSAKESTKQPKPDLSGVPAVVATVDGAKISKAEFVTAYESQFKQLAAQAQQTGQPLDQDQAKKQTVESMVNTQLLLAEADDRGYTASQDKIDSTLAELAKQSGLASPDELLASLAKQGVDKAEANRQLEGQVKLDQLVAAEGGDSDPTDKQLRELYDQTLAQAESSGSKADIPPFDEVRPQLEDQLRTQSETSVAQALVEDLRKDAKIKINL